MPSSSVRGACLTNCSVHSLAISLRRRSPEAKATIRIAVSRKAARSSPEHVASSLPKMSPVMALALLRARPVNGAHRKPDCRCDRRRGKRSFQTPPAAEGRPVGQTTPDGGRCMRPGYTQKALSAQFFFYAYRNAVIRFDLALLRPPQMMRDEFQKQGFRHRVGDGIAGCGH